MHRWSIGDVEIVRVESIDFAVPSSVRLPEWCIPDFAPSPDEVGIAFSALAVRSDDVSIVVDPWLADDGPRERADAAEEVERLLTELADVGFAADDVDLVVNTHLDGIGWNTRPTSDGWAPTFPNATYLYPADELAAVRRGEDLYGREGFLALDAATTIRSVEGSTTLTPSVSLEPAPGHNFGHVAVHIESGDELAIYPGHLVLSPVQIVDLNAGDDENPFRATAIATRRSLLGDLADRAGLLVTTLLGGPGAGVVRRDEGEFSLSVDS
jgi:glyoxylase-like metal-dependent hydrolase (beta-lactamase superfamily II)